MSKNIHQKYSLLSLQKPDIKNYYKMIEARMKLCQILSILARILSFGTKF